MDFCGTCLPLQPSSVTCLDANGEFLKVLIYHMAAHKWKGLVGATCNAMNGEILEIFNSQLRSLLSI